MEPDQIHENVWYVSHRAVWRAMSIVGSIVSYEDSDGNLGEMDIKEFARKCVIEAYPEIALTGYGSENGPRLATLEAMTTNATWNDKFPQCVNCSNNIRRRASLGFCNLCWRVEKLRRSVNRWRPHDLSSFVGSLRSFATLHPSMREEFKVIAARLLQGDLDSLKQSEAMSRGELPVTPYELEQCFKRIAELAGCRSGQRLFQNRAIFFDGLDEDGKRKLHRICARIFQDIPAQPLFRRVMLAYRARFV
ncbi:MAG: hypothetical protein ABSE64_04160 [Vulcanimicrobiaceae bacterium]|jgi:hypothetical protein